MVREISPFVTITKGEDTLDKDDNVVFSDFTPTIVSADEPEIEVVPKDVFAPTPVDSSGLAPATAPVSLEKPAPTVIEDPTAALEAVVKGTGKAKGSEPSTRTTSSAPKSG